MLTNNICPATCTRTHETKKRKQAKTCENMRKHANTPCFRRRKRRRKHAKTCENIRKRRMRILQMQPGCMSPRCSTCMPCPAWHGEHMKAIHKISKAPAPQSTPLDDVHIFTSTSTDLGLCHEYWHAIYAKRHAPRDECMLNAFSLALHGQASHHLLHSCV